MLSAPRKRVPRSARIFSILFSEVGFDTSLTCIRGYPHWSQYLEYSNWHIWHFQYHNQKLLHSCIDTLVMTWIYILPFNKKAHRKFREIRWNGICFDGITFGGRLFKNNPVGCGEKNEWFIKRKCPFLCSLKRISWINSEETVQDWVPCIYCLSTIVI